MWGAITFTRRSFRHFQNVISKMLPHWIHTFLHFSFFNLFSFHFSRLAASIIKLCTKYLHNTWKQDIITCTFVMHTISAAPKRAPTALIFGDFFAIFHAASENVLCRSSVEAILSTENSHGECFSCWMRMSENLYVCSQRVRCSLLRILFSFFIYLFYILSLLSSLPFPAFKTHLKRYFFKYPNWDL